MTNDDYHRICTQAIQRVYRGAVVDHLRNCLTEEQVISVFRRDWPKIVRAAESSRIGLEGSAKDAFDVLGVNNFYNLYQKYFDDLCPPDQPRSDEQRDLQKSALLRWMKRLTDSRNVIAHPTANDFGPDDVVCLLHDVRRALRFLQLDDAAAEVFQLRQEIGKPPELVHKMAIEGKQIQYLDNERESEPEFAVVYLHGLGLDCTDFYPVMNSPWRSFAPSMVGFHPGETFATGLALSEHCELFKTFIGAILERTRAETAIIVGFSTGADLALRIVRDARWTTNRAVGVLALDCNLNKSTCFISRSLASMDTSSPTKTLKQIANRSMAGSPEISTVLPVLEYLARVFGKFYGNLESLKEFAQEINQRFSTPGVQLFLDSCKAAATAEVYVQCVFSDWDPNRRALQTEPIKRARHLAARIEPGTGHFDLLHNTARLLRYVGDVRERVESLSLPRKA